MLPSKPLQIVNVMAVSLDGRIASHAAEEDSVREEGGFTSPDDRAHLERLLSEADAVIVGSSSLKASGGALEVVKPDGSLPLWIVLTQSGLPKDCAFFKQDKIPKWLVSPAPLAYIPPDVKSVLYGKSSAAQTIVRHLKDARMEKVLLFGGSEINRLFYEENLVDELILTVCPIVLGKKNAIPLVAPELPSPKHFSLISSHTQGDLVFLRYSVRQF